MDGRAIPTRPFMGGRFDLGRVPCSNLGGRRLGQAAASAQCNIPVGYGRQPEGGAAPGRAVVACPLGNGLYNVFNATDGSPVMSGVTTECLNQFGSFTIAGPGDSRCGGAGMASAACDVPAELLTKPLLACPSGAGYNIVDPATNSIVMQGVTSDCLKRFLSLTISTAMDPRCSSATPSAGPVTSMTPGKLTFPIAGMQFPFKGDSAPIRPITPPSEVGNALPAPIPREAPYVAQVSTDAAAPAPSYVPGQPIPATDWFGICKQMGK